MAAFAFRMYLKRTFNTLVGAPVPNYVMPPGTKFFSDSGREYINWPEQQYSNGVAKNERTRTRYKSIVRALKSLKYDMDGNGVKESKPITPFLIECLAYNVPDYAFADDSYTKNVRDCLAACYAATVADGDSQTWLEVNGIKYLFHASQPWTRQEANDFTVAAWRYCGFA